MFKQISKFIDIAKHSLIRNNGMENFYRNFANAKNLKLKEVSYEKEE